MTLITTDDAGVRLLTLNRPEARNAFNEALYGALAAVVEAREREESAFGRLLRG